MYTYTLAATTCLALEQLAADAREGLSCSTDGGDDCDTVTCTAELIGSPIIAQFQVLPCNDTPAVNVVVKAGSSVLIDRVVSESQEIPFLVYKVYVTLDQRDNSIGLEVTSRSYFFFSKHMHDIVIIYYA